jgi:BirA family biotin operon repressor/biotin-[acetyl-CoA-carboxylase] ligase
MEQPLDDLSPRTRWLGRRLDVYRCVDSTNRIAEELSVAGAPEGTLVLADEQTAGRGRLGRSFFSPGGRSIYLSALLRPREAPESLHRYIFVAAVSVASTVRAFVPPHLDVSIKWPNDVLLDGRKTSGINLPARIEAGRVTSAVLGIGVNVNVGAEEFPRELAELATSLQIAVGARVDRVAFAQRLIEALEDEIDRFRSEGFVPVLEAWRKFSRMQGLRVRVGGPGVRREIEGTAEGVDSDGALLVRTYRGTERVLAGDVTLVTQRR